MAERGDLHASGVGESITSSCSIELGGASAAERVTAPAPRSNTTFTRLVLGGERRGVSDSSGAAFEGELLFWDLVRGH